ncbi:hypothetical protein AB0L00_28080 [Actinoallomurus sp. NPDC052308]|uniref:hypothetical protein n=1 Tax=Actinoallomurus sp. NPDC052308 TaxID=3155530 RepID=UPI0034428BC7
MTPNDFFTSSGFETVFRSALVDRLRKSGVDEVDDLDAAYALTRLVVEELRSYGYGGTVRLTHDEFALTLRALRAVMLRIGISFQPPYRDFEGFADHWDRSGIGSRNTTQHIRARNAYLEKMFGPLLTQLEAREEEPDGAIWGVDGEMKNIIFGGPKPRIVLRDAINNRIDIVENEDKVLFYDQPFGKAGITWDDMLGWWRKIKSLPNNIDDANVGRDLYERLTASLDSDAEKIVLFVYTKYFLVGEAGGTRPALIPQVWLHYDPMTRRHRRKLNKGDVLERERIDFLMLLPRGIRIVIEVDGRHHYADDDGRASTKRYADMVAEDRRLRLDGYEVFRFGGLELAGNQAAVHAMLRTFFTDLLIRHRLLEAST